MKIRIIFAVFCVLVINPAIFAQTTIRLFERVPLSPSNPMFPLDPPYDFNQAISFNEKQISLTCPAGATAVLSGSNGGDLFVDNFFTVNGTNICPGGPQGNCFSALYNPIAPIDISSLLTVGTNSYTFRLMDYGNIYGNSDIDLTTNCTKGEGFALCHRDKGKREQKTIYVDSQDAVDAHVRNHGDAVGPCANSQ